MAEFDSLTIARFWSKVDKTSSPNDCWLWTAGIIRGGYGEFWTGIKMMRAHRASWIAEYGEIPQGMHVLHSCDSMYAKGDIFYRRCIRPTHLWLGTHIENIKDRDQKGRSSGGSKKGEDHSQAKLSETEIFEIRASTLTHPEIASRYRVSRSLIGLIRRREIWTHIA